MAAAESAGSLLKIEFTGPQKVSGGTWESASNTDPMTLVCSQVWVRLDQMIPQVLSRPEKLWPVFTYVNGPCRRPSCLPPAIFCSCSAALSSLALQSFRPQDEAPSHVTELPPNRKVSDSLLLRSVGLWTARRGTGMGSIWLKGGCGLSVAST